jgi:glycosyltransferase involved in cell wall biosynthesis
MTAGRRDVAAAIETTIPDDHDPALQILRGRLAYDQGRYAEALSLARAGGEAPGARRLTELIEGQVISLRPDWIPDIGSGAARLERLRGRGVRARIVHLVSISLPYRQVGYTIRTQSVAMCQRAAGLDAHVVTLAGFPGSEGASGAPREQWVDGILHHRVEPDAWLGPPDRMLTTSARSTASLLETLRPAVIQPATDYRQAKLALSLARPLGIPVVYEVRGFWEESWASRSLTDVGYTMSTERYLMTREAETASMLAADAIVTLSETMCAEIVGRGVSRDRIVIVPNAVDVDRFSPRPRDDALAASLGIGRSEVVVGYISSLNPYEGIPYLLEAVERLRGLGRPLRILLVGDGPSQEAIEAAAHRLGLDDGTLVMPGRVPHDEIARYHSIIDIFVVPRTADRVSQLVTPLKPYEAMAMERAVVISDVPALREIVTPGETGLIFKAEDARDLADVLESLLDDDSLRRRIGRQAREWVMSNRTWPENGRRYRELFERLGVA